MSSIHFSELRRLTEFLDTLPDSFNDITTELIDEAAKHVVKRVKNRRARLLILLHLYLALKAFHLHSDKGTKNE